MGNDGEVLIFNQFTYNRYQSDEAPNMTSIGTPASFPMADLPTSIPGGLDSTLSMTLGPMYVAHAVEQGSNGNGAVAPAHAQQTTAPALWETIANSLFSGFLHPAPVAKK